jgi:hypothetical protein
VGCASCSLALQNMGVADWMVERVASEEQNAERSLMHRYNLGDELVQEAVKVGRYSHLPS